MECWSALVGRRREAASFSISCFTCNISALCCASSSTLDAISEKPGPVLPDHSVLCTYLAPLSVASRTCALAQANRMRDPRCSQNIIQCRRCPNVAFLSLFPNGVGSQLCGVFFNRLLSRCLLLDTVECCCQCCGVFQCCSCCWSCSCCCHCCDNVCHHQISS